MTRQVLIDASFVAYWRHFSTEKNPGPNAAEWCELFLADAKPDAHSIVFDSPKNWRTDKHAEYKAHRAPRPQGVSEELDGLHGWASSETSHGIFVEGFEADDVIAALCTRGGHGQTVIVTNDKDIHQLCSPSVVCFDPMRNRITDHDAVLAKWGVPPVLLRAMLALSGDASDGIPGVPGIGPKKAAALVSACGSWENLKGSLTGRFSMPPVLPETFLSLVIQFRDRVRLNYELIGLRADCLG